MSEQEAPKIEFPCDYPIRIIGKATADFEEFVKQVVKNHAADFDGKTEEKNSRNGKFTSIMVTIRATGEPQLKALYEELKASGRVQMVI